MKTLTVALFGALVWGNAALAGGDISNGEALSNTCAACHGADGNSTIESNPRLAGQYASYIEQALRSYRDGSRNNAVMAGFAAGLSDQDIEDLAAYFAAQTPVMVTLPRD